MAAPAPRDSEHTLRMQRQSGRGNPGWASGSGVAVAVSPRVACPRGDLCPRSPPLTSPQSQPAEEGDPLHPIKGWLLARFPAAVLYRP